ncbi:MAG: hypothetical protein IKT65_04200, partial [Clostridia bacterium]|nr:hypothetical protein [Clostridia bacterium]
MENYDYISCGAYFITVCTLERQNYFWENHNHPSNGWFAQGLKAQYYRPAAQAAGFRILKPIAFATFAALKRAFV